MLQQTHLFAHIFCDYFTNQITTHTRTTGYNYNIISIIDVAFYRRRATTSTVGRRWRKNTNVVFFNHAAVTTQKYLAALRASRFRKYPPRKGESIRDTECKQARGKQRSGIVRSGSAATRRCNNSKTAILFLARERDREGERESKGGRAAYSLRMHVRRGSPYISPAPSLCVRGKITPPRTPAFLHRIFYRQGAHLAPILPLSSFICSSRTFRGRVILSVAIPLGSVGNSARSLPVIRRLL